MIKYIAEYEARTEPLQGVKPVDFLYIDELINYGTNKKAESTYYKCMKAGKYFIAGKIREKYSLKINQNDGLASFAMSLQALRRL